MASAVRRFVVVEHDYGTHQRVARGGMADSLRFPVGIGCAVGRGMTYNKRQMLALLHSWGYVAGNLPHDNGPLSVLPTSVVVSPGMRLPRVRVSVAGKNQAGHTLYAVQEVH